MNPRASRLLVLTLLLILAAPGFAQQRWERTFGDTVSWWRGRFACPTPDGGYIATGWRWYLPVTDCAFVIKTDANGDTIWTRTYLDWPQCSDGVWITPVGNGGYYEVADVPDSATGQCSGLMRLDASGNLLWWRGYPDPSTQVITTGALLASDGGFTIVGWLDFG